MIRIFSLFLIALFLTNCSTKHLSPVNVSDYFWMAQQEQKLDDAKKFVKQEDQNNIALQKNIKIKRFELAQVEENGDYAKVATKIYLQGLLSNERKDEIEVDFDTMLDKTEDGWKVNLAETKKVLYIETAKKLGTNLGAGILSKIKEGLGNLKDLQSIFAEMIDSLNKSIGKQ